MRGVIGRWRRRARSDGGLPLGFTMTDSKYRDLIPEHAHVARHIVGVSAFFVVAYDDPSQAASCALGLDTVTPQLLLRRSANSQWKEVDHLRVATTTSKFVVAKALADAEVNFLFW